MPRAVWTGTLAFGLVTIPVRLFPATEPKDVRFHLMDERGRRVRYRRFVEAEGTREDEAGRPGEAEAESAGGVPVEVTDELDEPGEVPSTPSSTEETEPPAEVEVDYRELMRGVETDDGRVVLMSPDEIEAARPERSRTIEIEDFVDLDDIDPVYFEKSYVVAPRLGAEKQYALLLRAIERSGRVGIGRFVLRTKPHLVAIRPRDGALGLETLFFGDEVRGVRALVPGVDRIEVSERELKLAETLIETLKTDWNAEAYADTYRDELLRRIAEKTPVEGPVLEEEPARPARGHADQLMEALRASVEAAKKERRKPGSRKRPA
jgi:DNA end-binding protein Ku